MATRAKGGWVILITSRRRLGGPVRAVPRPYLRQNLTMTAWRTRVFATKREAREFLRDFDRDTRLYLYSIERLSDLASPVGRLRRRPSPAAEQGSLF